MASCQQNRFDVTVIELSGFTPAQIERFTALGMSCEPRKTTYCDVTEDIVNQCMRGQYGATPVEVLEVRQSQHAYSVEMVTGNGQWGCE